MFQCYRSYGRSVFIFWETKRISLLLADTEQGGIPIMNELSLDPRKYQKQEEPLAFYAVWFFFSLDFI